MLLFTALLNNNREGCATSLAVKTQKVRLFISGRRFGGKAWFLIMFKNSPFIFNFLWRMHHTALIRSSLSFWQIVTSSLSFLCIFNGPDFLFLLLTYMHVLPSREEEEEEGVSSRSLILVVVFLKAFPSNNSNIILANQKGFQRSGWIREGGRGAHALCSLAGDHYVRTKSGSGLEPDLLSQAHVLLSSQSV